MTITIYLKDPAVKTALKAYAQKHDLSMSKVVRDLIGKTFIRGKSC